MRAAGAHYGILLLCRMTKRHWVLLNPRRKIEFPELLNLLKEAGLFSSVSMIGGIAQSESRRGMRQGKKCLSLREDM
jgi:hypothetical protein